MRTSFVLPAAHSTRVLVSATVLRPQSSTLSPYTTLFRSRVALLTTGLAQAIDKIDVGPYAELQFRPDDLKQIEYAALLRSGEHTSELQSPCNLVCRLLLEKKNAEADRPGQARLSHRRPT